MKKKTLMLLKIAAFAFLSLLAAYVAIYVAGTLSLRNAYAELRADRRPMGVGDIVPPGIKSFDNAALLYKAAAGILKAHKADGASSGGKEGSSSGAEKKEESLYEAFSYYEAFPYFPRQGPTDNELRKLLQSEAAKMALSLVEEAVKRPCRFERDYSLGPKITLMEVSEQRGLTRMLCTKASLEAEEGKAEEAWKTLLLALKVADSLREEPFLVSQLVRNANLGIVFGTMQKAAEAAPPGEGVSAELGKALETFNDAAPLAKCMDGERILLGEWCFNHIFDPELWWEPGVSRLYLAALSPAFPFDKAAYLKGMGKLAKEAGQTYSLRRKDFVPPFYCPISKELFPALATINRKTLQMRAMSKIAKLAFKAVAMKSLPKQISEIGAGDEIIDPLSGKEFIYKREGDGFILYSVGHDLKDDGGKSRCDICWRYHWPKSDDRLESAFIRSPLSSPGLK